MQEKSGHPVQLASVESVGATVSGITTQAVIAACLAGIFVLGISLFVKHGPSITGAIVLALLCDTFIAVGAICLFHVPLSLPIISALLTVAGYSVYDSIVVAGHVRHDSRYDAPYTTQKFELSLESLSRRLILTVTTTVFSALAIAVYCEGLLRDFGIVMVSGAVFGMMSTVAIVMIALKRELVRPDGTVEPEVPAAMPTVPRWPLKGVR